MSEFLEWSDERKLAFMQEQCALARDGKLFRAGNKGVLHECNEQPIGTMTILYPTSARLYVCPKKGNLTARTIETCQFCGERLAPLAESA